MDFVMMGVWKINVSAFCVIHQICGILMIKEKLPPLNMLQSALEEEVGTLRRSVDNLHNKLCVGLDIENHLKKRIHDLEKKRTLSEEIVNKRISGLLHYHSQHKAEVVNLLHDGYLHLKSVIDVVEEKIKQIEASRVQCLNSPRRDVMLDEKDCRDVHVNTVAGPELINKWDGPGFANSVAFASGDGSEALPRALQEKVAALLLLSQQEERHLLERNVNAALQIKVDELHRNLLQVTNEKVKALMELAQLKQEYQQLQEKINEIKRGKPLAEAGEKRIDHERDGRLKNLLKKTYLKHWIGTIGFPGDQGRLNYDGNVNDRSANSMYIARMKIEHATLKESLESMEHLTATVGRLRLSLSKVVESVASDVTVAGMLEALDNILTEAKLVKTALGSSLPVSWSTEEDVGSSGASFDHEAIDGGGESGNEKVDFVTAAGFEMVEILITASQILKDHITKGKGGSTDLS